MVDDGSEWLMMVDANLRLKLIELRLTMVQFFLYIMYIIAWA